MADLLHKRRHGVHIIPDCFFISLLLLCDDREAHASQFIETEQTLNKVRCTFICVDYSNVARQARAVQRQVEASVTKQRLMGAEGERGRLVGRLQALGIFPFLCAWLVACSPNPVDDTTELGLAHVRAAAAVAEVIRTHASVTFCPYISLM